MMINLFTISFNSRSLFIDFTLREWGFGRDYVHYHNRKVYSFRFAWFYILIGYPSRRKELSK